MLERLVTDELWEAIEPLLPATGGWWSGRSRGWALTAG